MLRKSAVLLFSLLAIAGCKTGGRSSADAFTLNGDAAAAHKLIVDTINTAYPDVAGSGAVVDQFATALQNGNTLQAASSDFVLQQAYAKMDSSVPAQFSEFDAYVIVEFAALTNYTTFAKSSGTALAYTGTTVNQSSP